MRRIEIDPDCWAVQLAAVLRDQGEQVRIVLAQDARLPFYALGVRRADGRTEFGPGVFCVGCGNSRSTQKRGCSCGASS